MGHEFLREFVAPADPSSFPIHEGGGGCTGEDV